MLSPLAKNVTLTSQGLEFCEFSHNCSKSLSLSLSVSRLSFHLQLWTQIPTRLLQGIIKPRKWNYKDQNRTKQQRPDSSVDRILEISWQEESQQLQRRDSTECWRDRSILCSRNRGICSQTCGICWNMKWVQIDCQHLLVISCQESESGSRFLFLFLGDCVIDWLIDCWWWVMAYLCTQILTQQFWNPVLELPWSDLQRSSRIWGTHQSGREGGRDDSSSNGPPPASSS